MRSCSYPGTVRRIAAKTSLSLCMYTFKGGNPVIDLMLRSQPNHTEIRMLEDGLWNARNELTLRTQGPPQNAISIDEGSQKWRFEIAVPELLAPDATLQGSTEYSEQRHSDRQIEPDESIGSCCDHGASRRVLPFDDPFRSRSQHLHVAFE